MELWHHALTESPSAAPGIVTLGNFDGVHAGHRQVLRDACRRAQELGVASTVVTFDPHPSVVVGERHPRLLMTLKQRLEAFRELGLDRAWVLPFTRAFSELAPEAFLTELGRALAPQELHVGKAFRFGRDRSGSLETLIAWGAGQGCEVRAHAFQAFDGGPLSSTRVRESLDAGDVDRAARLLGHPFRLTGIVVEGERRGRHLGFPTANLRWEQECLPANGVYVTEVRSPHLQGPRPGLTNVGEKPTFEGLQLTVETYLPGFQGDLYGAPLELGFRHRLRGERRFEGLEALQAQIAQDVAEGLAWWEGRA